jgi:SAM-dependent methyltransferase
MITVTVTQVVVFVITFVVGLCSININNNNNNVTAFMVQQQQQQRHYRRHVHHPSSSSVLDRTSQQQYNYKRLTFPCSVVVVISGKNHHHHRHHLSRCDLAVLRDDIEQHSLDRGNEQRRPDDNTFDYDDGTINACSTHHENERNVPRSTIIGVPPTPSPSPPHSSVHPPILGGSISRAHMLNRMVTVPAAASAAATIMGFHHILSPSSVAHATTKDPQTGILLPDVGEIESSIPAQWDGIENPILASDTSQIFGRLDKQPDSIFYSTPRFVEHVDENAVATMTKYISTIAIQPSPTANTTVLDLCSSWTSHIDPSIGPRVRRISGLGMNEQELASNPILTDYVVQDLNVNPTLSRYEDNTFDVVLCQLSIDYLTKPLEVLRDVGRVLKPGGKVHILYSNRLFLTKAIGLWTGGDDIDHTYYVGCYLHFCNGGFTTIQGKDLSTRRGGRDNRIVGDPMFVVTAVKG